MTGASATTLSPWSPPADTAPESPRVPVTALLVVAAVLAVASTALAWVSPLGLDAPSWQIGPRAVLGVLTASLVPGLPAALLLRLPDPVVTAALAVGASLASLLLVAQTSIVAGWWHPAAAQTLLGAVCLVLCALRAAGERGRRIPTTGTEPARRALRWTPERTASLAVLLVAALATARQAQVLDVDGAGALGVLTQLGWPFVVALALIAAVVAVGLRGPRVDHVVLAASCLLLVVLTTMLVSLADGASSVPTAWTHRGFIALLAADGTLPTGVDARFSWAAFFAAGAQLTTTAGLPDARPLLTAAPLYFDGLMILPVYVIGRALSGRSRTAWIGVLAVLLTNWYQQDYFAPQAVASFLWATTLATLLWAARGAARPAPADGGSPAPGTPAPGANPAADGSRAERLPGGPSRLPLRRLIRVVVRLIARLRLDLLHVPGRVHGVSAHRTLALEGVLGLLMVALVVTHQLTPMVAAVSLVVLVVTGTTRFRGLWVLTALVFAAWFVYGASDYWIGHLRSTLADVGQVGTTLQGGVGDRLGADPAYQWGQYTRLATAGVLGLLSVVGWWSLRGRRLWWVSGLLTAVPFGLVLVQSYGGEVVIRCFLLAAPIMGPLAAVGIMRLLPGSAGRWRPAGVAGLVLALVVAGTALAFTRGLNTSFERTSSDEIALGDELMAEVPDGAVVLVWGDAPYLLGPRMLEVRTGTFQDDLERCLPAPAGCTLEQLPDFVFVNDVLENRLRYQFGTAVDLTEVNVQALLDSGIYVLELDSPHATVMRRTDVAPLGVRS